MRIHILSTFIFVVSLLSSSYAADSHTGATRTKHKNRDDPKKPVLENGFSFPLPKGKRVYSFANFPATREAVLKSVWPVQLLPDKTQKVNTAIWQNMSEKITDSVFLGQAVVQSVTEENGEWIVDARRVFLRGKYDQGIGVKIIFRSSDKSVEALKSGYFISVASVVEAATIDEKEKSFDYCVGGVSAQKLSADFVLTLNVDAKSVNWKVSDLYRDRVEWREVWFKRLHDDKNPYAMMPFPSIKEWLKEASRK